MRKQAVAEAILSDVERSGIYKIVNSLTGKEYIGSAKCFRLRWNSHRAKLRKGNHHCSPLQNAWNKYGADAFEFEIIRFCDPCDLLTNEQIAIDLYSPEYNVCRIAGNTLGKVHSEEIRQKIRLKALGRKCEPRSEEYRMKLSEILRGKNKAPHVIAALQAGRLARIYTDEQKKQISESLKASYESGLRSRSKSQAHRNKLSQAFSKLTEDQVRKIRALSAAGVTGRSLAKQFETTTSTVSQILSGKRYRWVD
nr:GIY-YIG nuclease family protein [Pseudomonas zeshuii]